MAERAGSPEKEQLFRIIREGWGIAGGIVSIGSFGNGHINGTWRFTVKQGEGQKAYVLQSVNHHVFKDPYAVMENIRKVTAHLRAKGLRTLTFLENPADGTLLYRKDGAYWRLSEALPGVSYDRTDDPVILRAAGRAFGAFGNALSDLDGSGLRETIPGFHDTVQRFNALSEAEKGDVSGRKASVTEELRAYRERAEKAALIACAASSGKIPLRVTHNDTKFNNVIIDPVSKREVAVIDLDTVMPGTVLFDFGDAMRYLANTAAEDEQDIGKIRFDSARFRAFAEGFLGEVKDCLTGAEKESLALSPFSATVECGARFLTDHLNGDVYFRTAYPEHNLVRARNQLALAMDMERHEDEIRNIIGEILK